MKLFFRIILFIFLVYASVWSYGNVDFRSLFSDAGNLVKYEFSRENFSKSIDSFTATVKKHLT